MFQVNSSKKIEEKFNLQSQLARQSLKPLVPSKQVTVQIEVSELQLRRIRGSVTYLERTYEGSSLGAPTTTSAAARSSFAGSRSDKAVRWWHG